MAITSVDELVGFLRKHQLLGVTQLEELDRSMSPALRDVRALAKELLQRNWLTAYQINHILQGKGAELYVDAYMKQPWGRLKTDPKVEIDVEKARAAFF